MSATGAAGVAWSAGLAPLARSPLIVAGSVAVVLLLLAGRCGYHRDEVYFRVAGQHLGWGYVDQGPVTPLLARVQTALFGDSVVALRVWPALVAAAVVLLMALIAREVGAGRRGQLWAAAVAATSPGVLLAGHLLSTETTDLAVWLTAAWLVLRAARSGDTRWWVGVGAVLGVGLENKDLPVFLGVALLAGLVLARQWDVVRSRHLWLAALAALAGAAPPLIWQAAHGFPQWDVAQAQRAGTSPVQFVVLQLLLVNPVALPWAVRGARSLWSVQHTRPLLWAFALLEVLFLASSGKPYYPAPLLLALVAVGAGAPDPARGTGTATTAGRGPRRPGPVLRWALLVGVGALLAPVVLPVLPAAAYASSPFAADDDARATLGWPELAGQVDRDLAALPAAQRARTVLLTQNYTQAGALARFSRSRVLVVSGHNAWAS